MPENSGEVPPEGKKEAIANRKEINRRGFMQLAVIGGIGGVFSGSRFGKPRAEQESKTVPPISTPAPSSENITTAPVPHEPRIQEEVDHEYYDSLSEEQRKLVDETAYHLASVYTDVMSEEFYPTDDAKREFFRKVTEMGIRLNPDNPNLGNQIAAVMYWESGFSPIRISENGSEGIGLIQFTDDVPANLNTSHEELRTMMPDKQLEFVEKFFRSQQEAFGGDFNSLESVYTYVIAPQKSGTDSSTELYPKDSDEARRNGILDKDQDGILRKGEATRVVRENAVKVGENPAFL